MEFSTFSFVLLHYHLYFLRLAVLQKSTSAVRMVWNKKINLLTNKMYVGDDYHINIRIYSYICVY